MPGTLSGLLLARELTGKRSGNKQLTAWAENSFVDNASASYAGFQPPPRSTIALSFNCDGSLLASTQ